MISFFDDYIFIIVLMLCDDGMFDAVARAVAGSNRKTARKRIAG